VLFLLLYIKLNEKVLKKQGGQILCSPEWSHFSFGKTRRINPLLIKGFGFFLRKNKEDKSSPHQGIRIFPSEKQGGYRWNFRVKQYR
jgi:hypothetical protein